MCEAVERRPLTGRDCCVRRRRSSRDDRWRRRAHCQGSPSWPPHPLPHYPHMPHDLHSLNNSRSIRTSFHAVFIPHSRHSLRVLLHSDFIPSWAHPTLPFMLHSLFITYFIPVFIPQSPLTLIILHSSHSTQTPCFPLFWLRFLEEIPWIIGAGGVSLWKQNTNCF